MTTYKILAAIAVSMHQLTLFSMEKQIQLRQLDIVHQALGKISQGNTTDPIIRAVLENPTYTGELNQKAAFYGATTERKVLELIRAEKCALLQRNIAELTHTILLGNK